jgi:hypothetical protein
MSDGWLRDSLRMTEGQPMLTVSVTRLPPELARRRSAQTAPRTWRGEPGFAGQGGAAEPGFAIGSVTGYRWWALPRPDEAIPPCSRRGWDPGQLRGMHDAWGPGLLTARCIGDLAGGAPEHRQEGVPEEACSCGFWAYWDVPPRHSMGALLPVLGVIEGSGKTLIGETGFRCGQARIRALHLPDAGLSPDWHAAAEAAIARAYPQATLYRVLGAMTREYPPDPESAG